MAIASFKSAFLLATVIVSVLTNPVVPVEERDEPYNGYRLPNSTRPVTYKINLTTQVHKGITKFIGVVEIEFEALEVVEDIYLHIKQLNVISIDLSLAWLQNSPIAVTYKIDEKNEFLIVHVPGGLFFEFIYRMTISYEGNLRSDNAGFYMKSYKNQQSEDVYLATTQFESTDARHAFPCYDEPEKKAIFTISITHDKSYSAISNMEVSEKIVNNPDGTTTTTFEPTRLMSSYLIAFTVSDYTYSEKVNRIPHRIYSKPGFEKQHGFALDTSIATLNSLNDYLKVDYPLPKMDNVAIPAKGGAMENWGLVTYGEQYLLYDEAETTTSSKTTIATIISHEFAHQWFGDFVSPKWWTYTWLNEGFASLFEFVTTDDVFPEWDIMQNFVTGYLQGSLRSDSRVNPRPMTAYSESPSGISGLFDYVSYGKSGSVLRMIQHAFTDATFQKALTIYLNNLDYQSATEEDLFQGFKDATFEDKTFNEIVNLDAFLRSWTNQGGFPLITVTRDYESGFFTIKQEPFDGSAVTNASDARTWWVPFNFATAKDNDFSSTKMESYLAPGSASIVVRPTDNKGWTKDDWIILNKQATSYYRVMYDAENLNLLTKALLQDPSKIHKHNRAQLLEDTFRLVQSGLGTYAQILELMTYLKNETDYAPWATTNNILATLNNNLMADAEYHKFQFFVAKIVGTFYETVGISEKTTDAHLTKMIRSVGINWGCRSNASDCLTAANKKLRDFGQNGARIEPDLRASLMCTGVMKGTEFDLGLLLKKLAETTVQAQRNQILSGLGCFQIRNVLKTYLQTSIDTPSIGKYSANERLNILGYVVEKSALGVTAAIEFMMEKFNEYSKLSTTSNPVLSAIRSIAARVTTEEQNLHFNDLLERVESLESIEPSHIQGVKATTANNLAWTKGNRDTIMEWINKFYKDNGGKDDNGAATIVVSTGVLAIAVLVSLRSLL